MAFRAQWTFTFDRKNRMISFAKGSAPTERTNLWYDALGRVWQRWNDNPQTTDWAATAKRYVFDGSRLVQEHEFDVEEIYPSFKEGGGEGSEAMEEQPYWEYTYNKVLVDYLHQPGGLRQYRWDTDDEEYKTEFLINDAGMPGARIERGTSISTVSKAQRTASGDRQADAEVTEFKHLSNITLGGGFVEGYGATSGATVGFDPLVLNGKVGHMMSTMAVQSVAIAVADLTQSALGPGSIMPAEPPQYQCHMCSFNLACLKYDPDTGTYNTPFLFKSCWQGITVLDNCDLAPTDCNSCGAGVQCEQDLRTCYDIDSPDLLIEDNPCKMTVGDNSFLCLKGGAQYKVTHDRMEKAIKEVKKAVEKQPYCIPDEHLRRCIDYIDQLEYLFWCNCEHAAVNEAGCTHCSRQDVHGGQICINVDAIYGNPGIYGDPDAALAVILFHEIVHWCLGCRFRRPNKEQAAIEGVCQDSCFPGSMNIHYWKPEGYEPTSADCSICGGALGSYF